MNPKVKSVLLGLGLGLLPFMASALLYLAALTSDENLGSLASFGMMGIFFLTSVGVFITSIVLIVKKNPTIGGIGLITLIALWVFGLTYLMNYSG